MNKEERPFVIEAEDIVRTYDLGRVQVKALQGISFKVKRGEFVSIMGVSGSGKSTLLHILGCLDKPTSGRFAIEDIDISQMNPYELAEIRNKKIGFVFQMFNLIPRINALANVELPMIYNGTAKKERRQKAIMVLQAVGLGERINHNPNELSGGEQQRVAIARALITNPSIILADEPTGNLDTKSGAEIMNILKGLHQEGRTIITVTHDRKIAEEAEHILVLKDGLLVQEV